MPIVPGASGREALLDLPEDGLALELGSKARGHSAVRHSGADRRAAVEAIGDLHRELGDPSPPLDLDLLLGLDPPELQSVAATLRTGAGGVDEPLVGDQQFARDPVVAWLRPGLLPLVRGTRGRARV